MGPKFFIQKKKINFWSQIWNTVYIPIRMANTSIIININISIVNKFNY